MKRLKYSSVIALAAAFSMPLAGTAFAGENSGQKEKSAEHHMKKGEQRADITGRELIDPKGSELGSVERLVVGRDDNELYAVVSIGGFLGIGEKDVAVPYERLSIGDENVILMSQEAETELKNMPAFDEKKYKAYDEKGQMKDKDWDKKYEKKY